MAASLTVDAFLDVIQRSRLLSEEELQCALKELAGHGTDLASPEAIAAALVDHGPLTRWQADYLLQGKHKGFFLGPYRFLSLLGKGGMGAVYLAQHEMMRRRCAIKVLPARLLKDKSSVLDRFYLEAQAVAAMDHPNIVRAYDVNKEIQGKNEIHYLVMEYVEGKDLQVMIQEKSGGLDCVMMAEIARQAACGLAHAHDSGLIHRDIKPANLLLDAKGIVKVLDLGLARFFDDRSEASLTAAYNESVLGTADYLSPEQALNSHNVDTRTDIYSLGGTCYFMLTGKPPFPDGTVAQRLLAHQMKSPKPIGKYRPDIPTDLVAIVDKMMAKSPEKRYQTAGEVAEAFRSWLVSHADEAWKQQHRDVLGEGSGTKLGSSHEPTQTKSTANEDTNLDLGLSPWTRDLPAATATPPLGSTLPRERIPPAAKSPTVRPRLDEPPLRPLAQEDLFSDLGALNPLGEDPLAQPLDPLAADTSPATSSSIRLTGIGGVASGSGSHRFPAAGTSSISQPESGEKTHLLWLLLIGLGISVPLAAAILFVSLYRFGSPPHAPRELPKGATSSPPEIPQKTSQAAPSPSAPLVPPPSTPKSASSEAPRPEKSPDGNDATTPPSDAVTTATDRTSKESPPEGTSSLGTAEKAQPSGGEKSAANQTASEAAQTAAGSELCPPSVTAPDISSPGDQTKPAVSRKLRAGGGPDRQRTTQLSEDPSPEQVQQVLGGLREVAILLDKQVSVRFGPLLLRVATDVLKEEGIRVTYPPSKHDAAVLLVSLQSDKSEPLANLTLIAELRYANEESRVVKVWTLSRRVGQATAQAFRQSNYPTIIRPKVEGFFKEFSQACRAARPASPIQ